VAAKRKKRGGKRWIQKALAKHKEGALHRQLHIPLGEVIPGTVLHRAAHQHGLLGKRARLAVTLRGLSHKKKK